MLRKVPIASVAVVLLLVLCSCAGRHVAPRLQHNGDSFPDKSGRLGEFQRCTSGDCVMSPSDCGKCGPGQFLCPTDRTTCVPDASSYVNCPNVKGTHFVRAPVHGFTSIHFSLLRGCRIGPCRFTIA